MNCFVVGIGKIGRFIDSHEYTQQDLEAAAKVSRNTVSKVCNGPNYPPSPTVMRKIFTDMRRIRSNAKVYDF